MERTNFEKLQVYQLSEKIADVLYEEASFAVRGEETSKPGAGTVTKTQRLSSIRG